MSAPSSRPTAGRTFVSNPLDNPAARGAIHAVTNTTPHSPTVKPLMPMLSGSDPCSNIFSRTTAAASNPAPTISGHIGIVLARCTPPALAIEANGPSRTNLAAGPNIARIPQTIPAAAPITIRLGVKCAAMVAAGPGQHRSPESVHQICAEQETAWHAQQSTEETHHGAFAEHPAEQPDRFGADRADRPHHRSPVLHGQQDGVHGDENADDDAGQRGEVEVLRAVRKYGR